MKLLQVLFRPGFEAVDPRDGRLRTLFQAEGTLDLSTDGIFVHLKCETNHTIAPISSLQGAYVASEDQNPSASADSETPVAVPAAKPVKKGKAEAK